MLPEARGGTERASIRFAGLMASLPIRLVLEPNTALLGAASVAGSRPGAGFGDATRSLTIQPGLVAASADGLTCGPIRRTARPDARV